MIQAFIFLGNPGKEYQKTRHNVAWRVAEHWPLLQKGKWQKKFKGQYQVLSCEGENAYALKPETFMNKSGESVQALLQFFKIPLDSVLVIHDELELDFGQMELRKGGGLAAHNGLRSLASLLGSKDFYRLRLGISKPVKRVADYVLAPFSTQEEAELPFILEAATRVLEACFSQEIETLLSKYSKHSVF
jgi:PTH1 family peptidyl-tRNA hydrolase